MVIDLLWCGDKMLAKASHQRLFQSPKELKLPKGFAPKELRSQMLHGKFGLAKLPIKHPNQRRLEEALEKLRESGKLKEPKKKVKIIKKKEK